MNSIHKIVEISIEKMEFWVDFYIFFIVTEHEPKKNKNGMDRNFENSTETD